MQKVQQAGLSTFAFRQHQDPMLGLAKVLFQARQRFVCASHRRQIGQRLKQRVFADVFAWRSEGQLSVLIDPGVELFGTEEKRFGWQDGSFRVTLHQAVALARILPEVLKDEFKFTMQHHGRSSAQVIKNGSGFLKKERQVILNAGGGDTVANIFVDPALGWITIEQFTPATAKAGPGRIIHREFPAWQQADLRHRVQAALTVRIKGADGVDLIVEQVNPIGNR